MLRKQKEECRTDSKSAELYNEFRQITAKADEIVNGLSGEEKKKIQTVISLDKNCSDLFLTQLPYSIKDSITGQSFCPGQPDVGHVLIDELQGSMNDIEHLIQGKNVLVVARGDYSRILADKISSLGGNIISRIKL